MPERSNHSDFILSCNTSLLIPLFRTSINLSTLHFIVKQLLSLPLLTFISIYCFLQKFFRLILCNQFVLLSCSDTVTDSSSWLSFLFQQYLVINEIYSTQLKKLKHQKKMSIRNINSRIQLHTLQFTINVHLWPARQIVLFRQLIEAILIDCNFKGINNPNYCFMSSAFTSFQV